MIEILSKSTEERDRGLKFEDYALHQVQEYWIVDTENKFIEQYFLKNQVFELNQKIYDGRLISKIIKDFWIEVNEIFL